MSPFNSKVKKRRGRKRVYELAPQGEQVTGTNVDFDEVGKSSTLMSFGNLTIGKSTNKIKVNVPVKKGKKKKDVKVDNTIFNLKPEPPPIPFEELVREREKPSGIETRYRPECDPLLSVSSRKVKKYDHISEEPGEFIYPLFEHLCELTTFPIGNKTDVLCWWCCHSFDWSPRVLPTKHHFKSKKFEYTGNFCSWACARSYAMQDRSLSRSDNQSLLSLFLIKLYAKHPSGKPYIPCSARAPPRQYLKAFGGPMSIEEFRAASKEYEYTHISQVSAVLDRNVYLYCKKV